MQQGGFFISKSKIFLYCCVVFIAGIGLASFAPEKFFYNKYWFFLGALGFWVGAIIFYSKKNKKIYQLHLAFLLGVFLFLGLWRYALSVPDNTSDKIWFFNDEKVLISGIIDSEIEERESNQRFEMSARYLTLGDSEPINRNYRHKVEGKILVTADLYPKYSYGDEIILKCNLTKPEPFSGFAYDRYLARHDIYSLCYYGQITAIKTGQGNWFYQELYGLRDKMRRNVISGLGGEAGSLARAILLGDKTGLPAKTKEKFSQAGLSHIMAISGMHISIIAVIIMYTLINIGFSRPKAYYLSIAILGFYIMLIGLPASAMRAGLMAFLVLTALKLGRITRIERSITIVAACLLLFNPRLLRDDVGFILSFLAVLGIAYLYPVFDAWWERTNIAGGKAIRDIFFITMAVQIFTWPVLVYNFGILSIIAPVSNILSLWILPAIIVAGFIAIALSSILPAFSPAWFLPLKIALDYLAFIARSLSTIPYAYIELNSPRFIWLLLYYLILIIFIRTITRK